MLTSVHSVMLFASDPEQTLAWYSELLATPHIEAAPGFFAIPIGDLLLCVHEADAKGCASHGGSVVYWEIPDLSSLLERAFALGATLHRGPLPIAAGKQIAQLADPFGNLFGVVAPA